MLLSMFYCRHTTSPREALGYQPQTPSGASLGSSVFRGCCDREQMVHRNHYVVEERQVVPNLKPDFEKLVRAPKVHQFQEVVSAVGHAVLDQVGL